MKRLVAWVVLLLVAYTTTSAGGEFDALLAKVPPSANAVMLLNSDYVFASQIATKENWREKYEQAFAGGLVAISPEVRRMAVATELDFEVLHPTWTVASAELRTPLSLAAIARQRQGAIDTIDGKSAVVFRNDTYLVDFTNQLVGVMSPANRQAVTRWAREASVRKQPQLSRFLTAAVRDADQDAIVQAIDLQDAVPADVIKNKLKASPVLAGRQTDVDAFAKIVSSIQGLLLEVRLTDQITGRIILVFDENATALAPVAKQLFQEVLADNGLALEDLSGWNVEAAEKRLILKGSLTKSGMKRIFSLMDHTLADVTVAKEARTQEDAYMREKYQQQATLKYFTAIQAHLTELKGDVKDGATWGHMAQWIDYWAKQIDRMPQLDVDPEMLDYGGYITTQLRNASASLRGIGIRTGARNAQIIPETKAYVEAGVSPYMYGGPYNGYGRFGYANGYFEWRDVGAERRAVTAEEKAKGATDVRGIAQQLQDATAKIRRRMTEKYHVEFK